MSLFSLIDGKECLPDDRERGMTWFWSGLGDFAPLRRRFGVEV